MGVHGLWKLIEPTGKQVPLENLENKVLAVDVSIWMYQLTKGLQTTGGEAVPNAHILGLFNRICKLLYYRIKPVFVFDGGVPLLKKETIEARKRQKRKAQETSEELREKLLNNLMKRNAVNQLLGTDDIASSSQLVDDMFALPPLPERSEEIDEFESDSDTEVTSARVESFCDYKYGKNLHSIDVNSEHFKSLPPDIRHEILSELIETRKQNSWAKINEMPENSQDFSKFQLERLKKRRDVQVSLDEAAKEMGGRILTYSELEAQFAKEGIVTENLPSQRIVGDSVTRFVFITGKAGENAPAEQTKLSVEEEKPKENPAPKPSSQISASEFEKNIQVIEDCIFIKDSSSDDDYDMAETDIDYVRSLSNQEKLSQDEILKLIKQEQKSPEHSSSCIIESDTEEIPCTSRTAIERDKDDDVEIIEPSQKFEESRLSILSKKLSNVDKNDNGNSNVVQSQKENTSTEKLSLELFTDNDLDVPEKSASQDSLMCKSDEMVKTVMLPTSEEGSSPREFISEAKSMELFSESDSDDFIEVADNVEKSSYFKGAEKEIEITIDPNKIVEDDIFSDIFDTSEVVNETVISDRGDSNQSPKSHKFTSEIKLQNTLGKDVSDSMKDKFDQPPKSEKIPNQNNTILQSKPLDIPISENEKINEKTPLKESTGESAKTLTEIFNKVKRTEDFNKMKSQNVDKSPIKRNIPSQEELATIQKALNEEEHELLSERNRQERLGSTITQQMIIEAQELLQLFGIPYVVAPMEAEAQCAFLDQIDLTEGTITDDSDIWLFGGQKVYKNFFDNRKHVLQFRAIEIESFFKLSREQLIQMALLVGSDYTVGIEGIGPVTAIEILAYFSDPSNKPKSEDDIVETLRKFRIWLRNNKNNASKLARKCRNVNLSEAFPNISVVHAYLYPTVDDSKDGFTWAPPDLDGIRMFMKSKFGWKTSRIDDILLPVMKRLNNRNKQTTLDMYFKGKPFSQIAFGTVSKRVIQAINIMKSKSEEEPLAIPSTSKSPKKSPAKSNRTPQKTPAKSVEGMKSSPLKTPEKLQKNTPKKTRRTKKPPIIKKVPNALPVLRSSAPYFGEVIPQKEKDKMDAAKRKLEAVKIFQAKNKSKRNTKKRKVLPPKPDCSYLSESSAEEI